jgi:hypothetical protein
MEIEVTILNDTDEDELYFDTKTLLQHFDMSKVKDMKNDVAATSEGGNGGERKLSRRVRKGYEFRGVNITVSQKVSDDPGFKSATFRSILNQPLPAPPLGLPSETPVLPSFSPAHAPVRAPVSPKITPIKPQPSIPPVSPKITPIKPQPSIALPPMRGKSLDDSTVPPVMPRTKPRSSTITVEQRKSGNSSSDGDIYMNTPATSKLNPVDAPPPRLPRPSLSAGPAPSKANGEKRDTIDSAKVHDEIEFLRRLVTVMQDNSLKDMTFLREEVNTLSKTVEMLSGRCQQLESEVKALKKDRQQPSSMLGSWKKGGRKRGRRVTGKRRGGGGGRILREKRERE